MVQPPVGYSVAEAPIAPQTITPLRTSTKVQTPVIYVHNTDKDKWIAQCKQSGIRAYGRSYADVVHRWNEKMIQLELDYPQQACHDRIQHPLFDKDKS